MDRDDVEGGSTILSRKVEILFPSLEGMPLLGGTYLEYINDLISESLSNQDCCALS
jgi:hypothetical protein